MLKGKHDDGDNCSHRSKGTLDTCFDESLHCMRPALMPIQALKYVQDRAQACAHEEPYCSQQALLKALWQVLAALLKHPPGGGGGGGGALRLLGWGQVREGRGTRVQNFWAKGVQPKHVQLQCVVALDQSLHT